VVLREGLSAELGVSMWESEPAKYLWLGVLRNSTVPDLSLGCNYYSWGHRAKLTGAASYLPNGSPVTSTIGDLLASHRGDEVILQAQVQLIF
jgi:hypothetical protein